MSWIIAGVLLAAAVLVAASVGTTVHTYIKKRRAS